MNVDSFKVVFQFFSKNVDFLYEFLRGPGFLKFLSKDVDSFKVFFFPRRTFLQEFGYSKDIFEGCGSIEILIFPGMWIPLKFFFQDVDFFQEF